MNPAQVAAFRARIVSGQATLEAAYRENRDGNALLHGRSALLDGVLNDIWLALALPAEIALIAVGGYGAGRMFPYSDVDLLILCDDATTPETQGSIETLIGLLWDIGLDLGHSVRTTQECLDTAEHDITVQTALLEARLITGNEKIFREFQQKFRARQIGRAHV